MNRIALIVTGKVQGVGFRYFTYQKALEFKLSGFVKNNPDGSVYIEVEGDNDTIERFTRLIHEGPPAAVVTEISSKSLPPSGKFLTFDIKR